MTQNRCNIPADIFRQTTKCRLIYIPYKVSAFGSAMPLVKCNSILVPFYQRKCRFGALISNRSLKSMGSDVMWQAAIVLQCMQTMTGSPFFSSSGTPSGHLFRNCIHFSPMHILCRKCFRPRRRQDGEMVVKKYRDGCEPLGLSPDPSLMENRGNESGPC